MQGTVLVFSRKNQNASGNTSFKIKEIQPSRKSIVTLKSKIHFAKEDFIENVASSSITSPAKRHDVDAVKQPITKSLGIQIYDS